MVLIRDPGGDSRFVDFEPMPERDRKEISYLWWIPQSGAERERYDRQKGERTESMELDAAGEGFLPFGG